MDTTILEALRARDTWIFDLDGTLTVAQHDFAAIRVRLGIGEQAPILEALAQMPEPEQSEKRRWLDEMEAELAAQSQPARGAVEMLNALRDRGCRLGVLTRNTKSNAHISLGVTGLDGYFEEVDVLGRDEAPPKPDPAGIQSLLGRWKREPTSSVMLGDYVYDLEAGRNAGTMTVHVDALDRFDFGDRADLRVLGLGPLAQALFGR